MSVGVKDIKRRRTNKEEPTSPDMKSERDKNSVKERGRTFDMQQKTRQVYQAEDELVSKREASEDVDLFKKTSQKISAMMQEIQKMKAQNKPETEILNKRIECSMHFLTLRKLNRLAHLRCKKVREITTEAKQKTDQYHLQLQNLEYEVSTQEKEITKCLEFKSKDEDIKLVSEEDFYRDAPEDISRSALTRKDEHQRRLARLQWELEQRKRLADKLKETESLKEVVSSDIQKKREHLEQLEPKLSTVLEATKPVQEYLNMPFDEVKEQHRLARYLPSPLYVLYMQATGYRDACDRRMKVVIEGDTEEAVRMHELDNVQEEASEEEDQEEEDGREEGKKRKKHRRHVSQAEHTAAKKRELLKAHPLNIKMELPCKDNLTLHLVFYYLTKLRIVTVRPELQGLPADGEQDLLRAGVLLQCLYAGDDGNDSPNPANQYQLHKRGLSFRGECVEETGRPYRWVQRLAGLQFLTQSDTPETQLSGSAMADVIKRLRSRVSHRLALQRQISAIAKGVVCVPEEYQSKFPTKINSKIASWELVTFDDFKVLKHCEMLVTEGLVHENDMIYKVVLESGSARLSGHISISPDYPSQQPIFSLRLDWRSPRTRDNDHNIWLMEAEVNYHNEDMKKAPPHPHLLTNQIQRLLTCMDVYLESSSASQSASPIEFPREKIMPRMTRGPHRGMPFRYLDNVNIFIQR